MSTFIKRYKGKDRKIIEIDHSIAFTDGDGIIYINKNLKDFDPQLYDNILAHELEHLDGPYSSQDLKHDMDHDFPMMTRLKFCAAYPRALFYLSPIVITEDKIAVSGLQIFQIVMWICCIWLLLWWLL